MVERVAAATATLCDVDPTGFDADAMRSWLEGVENVRRTVEAAAVAAAGTVDRSNPFRSQGFFTAKTVVKHMCRLSGPEAHRRVQTARLHSALPAWAEAEADGDVGVAQSELMARVVANPRLPAHIAERDSPELLDDAIRLPYDDFERRVRTWEALADPEGDRSRNERRHANRDVQLRPRPEGGWTLSGTMGELPGCEFAEIFSWFCDAEWHADWAEARERLGDAATTATLRRTEAQRRADALLAMARAAASTHPDARGPRPTTNILIDHESFEARLRGETPDPATYRSVVVRTQSGRRLSPDDAVNAALIGHIRRVVYDGSGHRHRSRSTSEALQWQRTRGGDAAAHHLRLGRLRSAHRLVRRRPFPRMEGTRGHRPEERRRTLPGPQPPQGTRIPRLPTRRRHLACDRPER